MRAALYARVSSAAQRERHTIESQLPALREYCQQMGWSIVGTYVDDGRTAKAGHLEARLGFGKLTADMALARFDVVVVVSVDRLTRSEDQVERGAILGAFQRHGVKLAVLGAGVQDLGTFHGDAYVTLQALFAAEANRNRRDNIVRGKARAIAEGKKPAGPTPYGYRYDRTTGAWSVHELEAETVREVYRRVAAGESTLAIARDFNDRGVARHPVCGRAPQWERERVWSIATKATYRGEWLAHKKRRLVVKVPPIVTDDVWYAAQAAIAANSTKGLRRTKHVYLLEQLAVCGECGEPVHIASAVPSSRWSSRNTALPGTPARYVCARYQRPLHGKARCGGAYQKVAGVDERVWAALKTQIMEPAWLERVVQERAQSEDGAAWEKDLADAKRRLGRLEKTEAAILARFRTGKIGEVALDGELEAIGRERTLLQHTVAGATRALSRAGKSKAAGLAQLGMELRRRVEQATTEERRALMVLLFDPKSLTLHASGRVEGSGRLCLDEERSIRRLLETRVDFRLVA